MQVLFQLIMNKAFTQILKKSQLNYISVLTILKIYYQTQFERIFMTQQLDLETLRILIDQLRDHSDLNQNQSLQFYDQPDQSQNMDNRDYDQSSQQIPQEALPKSLIQYNQTIRYHKASVHFANFEEKEGSLSNNQIIVSERKPKWEDLFKDKNCSELVYSFLYTSELINLSKTSTQVKKYLQTVLFSRVLTYNNQMELWEDIVGYKHIIRHKPQYYNTYASNFQEESQHSRDLDRTFLTQQIQLYEGQSKLDRLLRAFNFTVGYFQGLNYISAAFLKNYSEEQSYWFIRFLLQKVNYIQNNMENFNILMSNISTAVEAQLPQIHNHIIDLELDLQYFASRWILTLFSYDTTVQTMLILWKLISVSNSDFLVCFIVCVLRYLEKEILQTDEQSLNIMLKRDLKLYLSGVNQSELFSQTIQMYIQQYIQSQICIYDESLEENVTTNKIVWI